MHEFPVSQFYDRKTQNIARSQIGFIDFIIKPSFSAMKKVFPELANMERACDLNKDCWLALFDEYETELNNGNNNTEVIDKYLPKCFTPPIQIKDKFSKHEAVTHTNQKSNASGKKTQSSHKKQEQFKSVTSISERVTHGHSTPPLPMINDKSIDADITVENTSSIPISKVF